MNTYREFWEFYLKQHSKPWTIRLHVFGTLIGIMVGLFSLYQGRIGYALLGFVVGYGASWLSHFLVEKNVPASWTYPWWSFISEFRMIYFYLTRKL